MKRKIIFGTVLGLLAIVVIASALFLPSLADLNQGAVSTAQTASEPAQSVAPADQNTPSVADSSQPANPTGTLQSTVYVYGGNVYLHLPLGGGAVANHPTDLQIIASHVYNSELSDAIGADTIQVTAWVPTLNSYIPVAILSVSSNTNFENFAKALLGGGPASQNVFSILPGDLKPGYFEVERSGDIVTAILKYPISIKIGDPFPQYLKDLNFTLPPFTLEFHTIGTPFQISTTLIVPTSGWTIQQSAWVEPAWTRVSIPQWLGGATLQFDGTISLDETVSYYSP